VLEVADTGIGMTEDRLAQLSQPFAFGDAAFAKEHEGAGLGIAIARAIVELSGGRLAIDSSPALGTTVAVSLPMAAEQQATLVRAA
jgi:two-component system, cell cycle sensor histidine kinase PleC